MLKRILSGLTVVLVAAGILYAADDSWRFPVPTLGGLNAGDLIYAKDANNLGNTRNPTPDSITVGTATPTAVTNIRVYSQTITPASVAAAVCAEQTFTVTGLTTTDKVFYNPPATGNATSAAQVRVSAANTLAVMYCNPTAGALTPGAGTGVVVAIRS